MVLSLSPGPTAIEHHTEVGNLAQMWRVSNDIWDLWIGNSDFPIGIKSQFDNAALWAQYTKPGNWPDLDMLPIGELRPYPDVGPGPRHTRFTAAEQQTQLSLWALARSPLIVGANLTLLDKDTLRLLGNADILKIDQTAKGSRQVLHESDLVVWTADLPSDQRAIAHSTLAKKASVSIARYRISCPQVSTTSRMPGLEKIGRGQAASTPRSNRTLASCLCLQKRSIEEPSFC